MSQILFNAEGINSIAAILYVKNVSEELITYTTEFREKFMSEYDNGKLECSHFS